MRALRLGTRGSPLALFQADAVAGRLRALAGASCEIVVIKTSGDRLAEAALAQAGGKRLFVKEIEDALLEGAIDLAVHSSKDMPVVLPDGLMLGASLPREDPRDAVVLGPEAPPPHSIEDLPQRLGRAPRIGTSSIRRTAQLLRLLPGARFGAIRGNLDTRLRKLDAGEFDALILAAAGLRRLGHGTRIAVTIPPDVCVPAPGQGIIAVEVRRDDAAVRTLVEAIGDPASAAALAAERMVVRRLGGGCQMPIGAYAAMSEAGLRLHAVVVAPDGSRTVRAEAEGAIPDAEAIGTQAATVLLAQGAADILADVDGARRAVEGRQA